MQKIINLKEDIKKQLIEYYERIKSEIDIKGFELLESLSKRRNAKDRDNTSFIIIKLNEYLVNQIDSHLDKNLNEINEYFNSDLIKNLNTSNQEDVKRNVLKSYLIYFDFNESMNYLIKQLDKYGFGLLFEFEWYLDENEQNYVK